VQLDRIEIKLRRRSPWEALDLGLVMLRRWRGPVYRLWLAMVLPVAIGILAVLWERPQLGMLVVWWMKPLADRLLLKLFSESIFGEPPTLREVWRSIPALLRHSGLLSALTLRRFSPYRSFELPMLQLEGQRTGVALRQRKRTLSRKVAGHAIYLMQVCACVVLIFEAGLALLAGLLIPGDASGGFSPSDLFFGDTGRVDMYLFSAAWLVAESIVEPFYVAAGFSLYLNRRSELEGWDIEVAFRHMAESHARTATPERPPRRGVAGFSPNRRNDLEKDIATASRRQAENHTDAAAPARPSTRGGAGLAIAALWLGAQIFLALPEALAAPEAETADAATVTGEASRALREVLSDPVFGGDVEEMRWQPRRAKEATDEEARKPDDSSQRDKFLDIVNWLAWGMRGVLYVIMAVALAVLLVVLYRYSGRFRAVTPPIRAARAPETLFGLDLRPVSLPANIPATAWAEAEAGRMAVALSLLYRGALVAMIERYPVAFRDGDTENVCLQRVVRHAENAAFIYFSSLLSVWKASAYAGSPPSLAGMRALCQGWKEHFAGRGGAA
jgi:hypothetical protein